MTSLWLRWKTALTRAAAVLLAFTLLSLGQNAPATASPNLFASSLGAGCYQAKINRCKIHVDPFTIHTTPAKKLSGFQLTATSSSGVESLIYDFRTSQSNPVPHGAEANYTPSLVAKDFGVSCGESYSLSLRSIEVSHSDDIDDEDEDKAGVGASEIIDIGGSAADDIEDDDDDKTGIEVTEMRTLSTTGVFTCPASISAGMFSLYLPTTIK